jgi:hypothetical protein
MDRLESHTIRTLLAFASLTLLVVALGTVTVVAEERDDDPPKKEEETEQAEANEKKGENKGDTKKGDPVDGGEKSNETFVFTNDDLEARYGSREPARRAAVPLKPAAPKSLDPKGKSKQPSNPEAEIEAENAARRAEIEAEIERLRKREASLRNPFLPRVETTDEEKQREAGKDNATRLHEVQQRIRELEKELAGLD